MMHKRKQLGFTLLEVMIALMILVIAVMAVIISVNENIGNLSYLRDKTAASWVASNVINEINLGLLNVDTPAPDIQGTMPMFDKQWSWEANATATANASVLSVEVSVYTPGARKKMLTFIGYKFNVPKN